MKKTLLGLLMLNYCLVFSQEKLNSLSKVFSEGKVGGHARSFYMHTFNEGDLTDYWTNAVGMSLQYESLEFHGFSIGIDGVFTFKTFSSDLNAIDSVAGKSARWEKQLYDVRNPNNDSDMDRLEELYLHFKFRNGWLKYGKFAVKETPLLRLRDGRMKPFSFEGFQGQFNSKLLDWNAGSILKVTPRGTTHWYSLTDAIGLFNNGYATSGEKANYLQKASTKGLFWIGISREKKKKKTQFWSYYLQNQFLILWTQWDQEIRNNLIGVQVVYETATNEHNQPVDELYINNGSNVGVVSTSVENRNRFLNIGLQLSRVFGNSRFTFPKELGLEGLYTSIPRSWIEGLGDAEVYNLSLKKSWSQLNVRSKLQSSFVRLNQPNNFRFNKYNLRDYLQTNLEFSKEFERSFDGFELTFLYASRFDVSGESLKRESVFNSTNYHQLNLILNFEF